MLLFKLPIAPKLSSIGPESDQNQSVCRICCTLIIAIVAHLYDFEMLSDCICFFETICITRIKIDCLSRHLEIAEL